jgi:hypothetical protein
MKRSNNVTSIAANPTSNGTTSSQAAPHRKNAAQRNRSDSPYQGRTAQKDNPTQLIIKQESVVRCRLNQEDSCLGEHGINKEACNAKSGGKGRMFGSIDGMRLVLTARASIAKRLSEPY